VNIGEEPRPVLAKTYMRTALPRLQKRQWRSIEARVLIGCGIGSALVHIVVKQGTGRWGYAEIGSDIVWALLAAAALWVAYRAVIFAFVRAADFPG